MIFYNLGTYKKDKALPHYSCIYKLSKNFGKNNREITEKLFQKYLNNCVVFKGTD